MIAELLNTISVILLGFYCISLKNVKNYEVRSKKQKAVLKIQDGFYLVSSILLLHYHQLFNDEFGFCLYSNLVKPLSGRSKFDLVFSLTLQNLLEDH